MHVILDGRIGWQRSIIACHFVNVSQKRLFLEGGLRSNGMRVKRDGATIGKIIDC